MLPICFALLFAIGAVSSGLFASYVIDTSNLEVLVSSPHCASANLSLLYEPATGTSTHFQNLIPVTKAYAQECYQKSEFIPARCRNTFVRPNISFAEDPTACPFAAPICPSGPLPALAMDSGLLDQSVFGFNVRPDDGVKFRKRTVCNVLPFASRAKYSDATEFANTLNRDPLPQEQVVSVHYQLNETKATFSASTIGTNISESYGSMSRLTYMESMDPTQSTVNLPIVEMNRTDADVAINIIWLNNIQYTNVVDDPMFSSHQPRSFVSSGVNFTNYRADNPGGLLGCTNQFQFCFVRKGRDDFCTPLEGLRSTFTPEILPEANDIQLLMLQLIRDANLEFDISTGPIFGLTQASEFIQNGLINSLPIDHWKREAIGWESFAWAGIQIRLADYGIGPKVRDPAADRYTQPPSSAAEKRLCQSMIMRKAGGFANLNLFGLVFIVSFSFLISILNIFILRFCIFLSRFRRALAPRIDRWIQDGVFQLQRRAFDAHGAGTWLNIEDEIPSTNLGEYLDELPVKSTRGNRNLTRMSTFGSVFTTSSESEKGSKERLVLNAATRTAPPPFVPVPQIPNTVQSQARARYGYTDANEASRPYNMF